LNLHLDTLTKEIKELAKASGVFRAIAMAQPECDIQNIAGRRCQAVARFRVS
jgi:hypothetical protein